MAKKESAILKQIKGYKVFNKTSPEDVKDMVKFAKRAAKLVNNRLYKLGYANLTSGATTGGVTHIPLAEITDKASAARAISKAKSIISNPLSTPGTVNELFREAEKEYGYGSEMRFIAKEVPVIRDGKETGKVNLVPVAVPVDTNLDSPSWEQVREELKNFWDWADENITMTYTSDDAYANWVDSNYDSDKAIESGMKDKAQKESKTEAEYKSIEQEQYGKTPKWRA